MTRRPWTKITKLAASLGLLFVLSQTEEVEARTRPLAARFTAVDHPLRIVAHRGGAAFAPENTLAAYRAAIARGDEAAECDVQVSSDGELVVIHDGKLERTTDGRGRVKRRSSRQLSQLDASGKWKSRGFEPEPPPRLADVLDLTRDRMVLFIELKRGDDIVDKLATELARRPDQREQLVILSFDPRLVEEASKKIPDVPRMLLRRPATVWSPRVVDYAQRHGATMLGLDARAARPGIVRRAHERGLPVYAFTVNHGRTARELVSMGVDGIITDAPPRIAAVVPD